MQRLSGSSKGLGSFFVQISFDVQNEKMKEKKRISLSIFFYYKSTQQMNELV